ncbi:N-acetylglucosamine-6-phosphate deacetylase [Larkinella sp. VNQ87]|uniref:N-acetylglucosamine-6-phosphate deacetylase n=1 Tax=Larkinella sp. VNQ87 TaxID=3400921 RepID=UPI003C0AF8FE
MQELTLTNAMVFTGTGVLTGASVRIANGLIQEVTTSRLADANAMDLRGQWLVPGLVDLQVYGGSEQFLNAAPTAQTVSHLYETHLKNGTTSVLPTLFSSAHEAVLQAIEAVREVRQTNPVGVLGLHLEGPYVNPVKRGVHSALHVRSPIESELNDILKKGRDVVQILTLAPELFPSEQLSDLIRPASDAGIRLSLGHSNATYQEATAAFQAGIPLATHLYNAMRPFESREPGCVGAIFDHPTVRASIVADGFHCDWATIRIAKRLLGDRLFLISDALFANPPRASCTFEDLAIRYEDGRYTNTAGQLAGSSITLLDAVRNVIRHVGIDPAEAFRMASTVPADILGLGSSLGKIEPGFVANLVVLTDSLTVSDVIVGGRLTSR